MSAAGTRCRLVTEQAIAAYPGTRHVSTVVFPPAEIDEQLACEVFLHVEAGWAVSVELDAGRFVLVCERRGVSRRMWVQTYGPMDDIVNETP